MKVILFVTFEDTLYLLLPVLLPPMLLVSNSLFVSLTCDLAWLCLNDTEGLAER